MPRIAFLTLSSSLPFLALDCWGFAFNVVVVLRNPELYLREGMNKSIVQNMQILVSGSDTWLGSSVLFEGTLP